MASSTGSSGSSSAEESRSEASDDDVVAGIFSDDKHQKVHAEDDLGSAGTAAVVGGDNNNDDDNVIATARRHVKPLADGLLFRALSWIYVERAYFFLVAAHFVSTAIVWVHFALAKAQQIDDDGLLGPDADDSAATTGYGWKRAVPPILFGSKHAILFQMALLPLTMCRHTIASLSASSPALSSLVPLNRMQAFHAYVGYVAVGLCLGAASLFVLYFSVLCALGDDSYCSGLYSEIMVTGYVIAALMGTIGVTSYLRHRINYEVFYFIHNTIFVLYILTIAHTLDGAHRIGRKSRSQAYWWVLASLVFYILDRITMCANQCYTVPLIDGSASTNRDGSRTVVLKLKRPPLMQFKPGQYAFLRCACIDRTWHPFTIASRPGSSTVEFFSEVYNSGGDGRNLTWTESLWAKLCDDDSKGGAARGLRDTQTALPSFQIKGPYGTPLGTAPEDYSHCIAIGSGTGIVPVMSMLKAHAWRTMQINAKMYFNEEAYFQERIEARHEAIDARQGSIVGKAILRLRRRNKGGSSSGETSTSTPAPNAPRPQYRQSVFDTFGSSELLSGRARSPKTAASLRGSVFSTFQKLSSAPRSINREETLRDMKNLVSRAKMKMYLSALFVFLPLVGVAILGLVISSNSATATKYENTLIETDQILALTFHAVFLIVGLTVHESSNFTTLLDVAIGAGSIAVDGVWTARDQWGILNARELVFFSIATLYMICRLLKTAMSEQSDSYREASSSEAGVVSTQTFHFVWVTRSARLASLQAPNIDSVWKKLCEAFGDKRLARSNARISIYVTDKDDDACNELNDTLRSTQIGGFVHYCRPDFQEILESHALELLKDKKRKHANTLVAYCGASPLSKIVAKAKSELEMVLFLAGTSTHKFSFQSDAAHGVAGGKKPTPSNAVRPRTNRRSTALILDDDKGSDGDGSIDGDEQQQLRILEERLARGDGGACVEV